MTSDLLEENQDLRKQVAELELKIRHLTEHLSFQSASALFKQVEEEVAQEQRIKVLEKENTELKEAIKHFNPCGEWNDDVHDCEFRHYAMEYGSKLAEAKEIIKKVSDAYKYVIQFEEYADREIVTEAEQFLKEE